jgi:hypothetical protein
MSPPIHSRWMTLRRFKREISWGVIHLIILYWQVGHTPQWQRPREKTRTNPQNKPSNQTLTTNPKEVKKYNLSTTRIVSMSSQYFDTANHKKFQCNFAFMNMDWKSISQDWSCANVANIWSSQHLHQLLTCNQLLIKLNLIKHQYKSNWCLIMGFL